MAPSQTQPGDGAVSTLGNKGRRLLARSGILALLGLALWNPTLPWGAPPLDLLVLVDDSESMPPEFVDGAWRQVAREARGLPSDNRIAVIRFGSSPALELAPTKSDETSLDPHKPPRRHPIDPTRTDVQTALATAMRLTVAHRSVAVVLISDLGETNGHAEAALLQARQAGIPVYGLWPEDRTAEAEIEALQMAARVPSGHRVPVTVPYTGSAESNGTLELRIDGQQEASRAVELRPGLTDAARFWLQPKEAGVHSIEAVLDVQTDHGVENDRRRALLNVEGAGSVLYVTRDARPTPAATALLEQGLHLRRVAAADFLTASSRLPWHSAVVLDDLATTDLSERDWRALAQAVKEYGTGLVVLGGPNSFGAGGYPDSPLEDLLPVEVGPRDRQPPAAVLFALDKSGSMGRVRAGVSRLARAQRAVRETTATLLGGDEVGLMVFDIEPKMLVPLHISSAPGVALGELESIRPGGGTRLAPALHAAVKQLGNAQATRRMLVLVTDGFLPDESISALETEMPARGISFIALAVGADADLRPLERLAGSNDGAVLAVADIATLPRLMRSEVEKRRVSVEWGDFPPRLARRLPFAPEKEPWPRLTAYAVTHARPGATVYLESEGGDPLLAAHRVGAGRVVALPAGLAEWAPTWPAWSQWGEFTRGLVEWVAGSAGTSQRDLRVISSPDELRYVLDAADERNAWMTGQEGILVVRDPIGRALELPLAPVGPGRYIASVAAPLSGPYFATLRMGEEVLRHATLHTGQGESAAARRAERRRRQWVEADLIREWPTSGPVAGSDLEMGSTPRPLLAAAALLLYVVLLVAERTGFRQAWRRLTADAHEGWRSLPQRALRAGRDLRST